MNESLYRRRRLRLGALLFQLRYYMQAPDDIAADIYRYGPATYARVVGEQVCLVEGDHAETLDLEEAIARCKAALAGGTLHRSPRAESNTSHIHQATLNAAERATSSVHRDDDAVDESGAGTAQP